jgi:serine-type D-Ala-D-Ala carboxypeptidase (penicillin-binding protein 5/6)
MKNYTSESAIQGKTLIPPIVQKSLPKPKPRQSSSRNEKPSTPQHTTKLPFLSFVSDEPTHIRRILYYKPEVSARSWIILDGNSGLQIDGCNENEPREIASLTKIMTCVIVIQEVIKLKKSFDEYVEVSENAAAIDGTRAGLNRGDSLRIWDLLYGLMLPSGNDAALALAEHFGGQLGYSNAIFGFTSRMNSLAKMLKLGETVFRNPHGMSTSINVSTAKNIANLALFALRMPIFCKIVNTYSYTCTVCNGEERRKVTWINTNRLLRKGFNGVKTGYTPAAGPCLCSYIEQRNKKLLIVMLNVKSMQSRWSEAAKLWKWANAHILTTKN